MKRQFSPQTIVYKGDVVCDAVKVGDGKPCVNMAYHSMIDAKNVLHYRCGVHSDPAKRLDLRVDPKKRQRKGDELAAHREKVAESATQNRTANKKGELQCQKMLTMKDVPLVPGYLNVFPNNRHENRADGYGCSELSPMRLGPVVHRQPGLPDALNIENYFQQNKAFTSEVTIPKPGTIQKPTEEWYKRRKEGYLDPVPHRHKAVSRDPGNPDVPVFSVHLALDGSERHFTYIQSRYFYCKAYEALARRTTRYVALCQSREDGTNLMICGFDAYPVTKSLYEHYCDGSKPFGHELVLYTMLITEDPVDYPWNRYRRENAQFYTNIAHVLSPDDQMK